MKKLLSLAALAALLLLVSSCDLFRVIAGRPTSADIANKKLLIEQIEKDRAAMAVAADIPAVTPDTVRAAPAVSRQDVSAGVKVLAKSALDHRYYIIIGSFSERDNAEKLGARLLASGYPVTLITYLNGTTAVSICPTDDHAEAAASLRKAQDAGDCPKDAWILKNE